MHLLTIIEKRVFWAGYFSILQDIYAVKIYYPRMKIYIIFSTTEDFGEKIAFQKPHKQIIFSKFNKSQKNI